MPEERTEVIPYSLSYEIALRKEMRDAPPYELLPNMADAEGVREGCYRTPLAEGDY